MNVGSVVSLGGLMAGFPTFLFSCPSFARGRCLIGQHRSMCQEADLSKTDFTIFIFRYDVNVQQTQLGISWNIPHEMIYSGFEMCGFVL